MNYYTYVTIYIRILYIRYYTYKNKHSNYFLYPKLSLSNCIDITDISKILFSPNLILYSYVI